MKTDLPPPQAETEAGKPVAAPPRPTVVVTAKPPKQIDAYKRLLKLRAETGG